MNDNLALQYIKAWEERYLIEFKLTRKSCTTLGLHFPRLQKVVSGTIEPTDYEVLVLSRLLKLPRRNRRKSPTVIDRSI